MFLSALLGLDLTRTHIYQLFALLASCMTLAFFASTRFRVRFIISRNLPAFATVGERFQYRIRIQNNSPTSQRSLSFQEQVTPRQPTYEEFMNAREPDEKSRNWWDQKMRYHRFLWLAKQHMKTVPPEIAIPEIGANSTADFYAELQPLSRGYLYLAGAEIKRPDPFGLIKTSLILPVPARILVLPKRYPLPPIHLPGNPCFQPGGVHFASSVGNADEFHSLREYRPGDPVRMLHWKSLAKTGQLIVRENKDEFMVRYGLVLDTSCAQPYSRRFEVAVSIAASFACSIQTQESMLDLLLIENQAYCFSAGRGVDHTSHLLKILAEAEPYPKSSLAELENLIAEHVHQLSGCICILLGWDQARQDLVRSIQAREIAALILVITDGEDLPDAGPSIHFINAADPATGLAQL